MKKKILSAFLCIALPAVLLSGCAPGGTTEPDSDKTTDSSDKPDESEENQSSAQQDETKTDETASSGEKKKIALSMPEKSSGRWVKDAANMKKALEALDYSVEIQFAENDAKLQEAQIADFIAAESDCIVIAAADAESLVSVSESAKEAGIPVIAYDRLLMDTDAVHYFVSFDNKGVGTAIGKAIAQKAGLEELAEGEYKTIEFFMGSKKDKNARLLYNGLMEVMQPYLDDGRLVCRTERTSFDDTCISDWSLKKAQERCENYLEGYYMDEELDICAAASDGLAYGCIQALQTAGYTDQNWPVISGQDCEALACKYIQEGIQSFSIYKDTRVLAERCTSMVQAAVPGTEAEINDTEQYDNRKLIVPAYLCMPSVVDKDNLEELIIDGGYYTADEIAAASAD